MSDEIRFTLLDGMQLAGVDLEELWWRYAALGGSGSALALADQLRGITACEPREHNLIAQALNEAFLDQGSSTFPVAYTAAPPPRRPAPLGPAAAARTTRSAQARHAAVVARQRSAAAARRSAALHASAAQLMQASGQLQFARHARERARLATQRGTVKDAA